jgi:hypothetical protein
MKGQTRFLALNAISSTKKRSHNLYMSICKAVHIELNSSLLASKRIYISILMCNLKKAFIKQTNGDFNEYIVY